MKIFLLTSTSCSTKVVDDPVAVSRRPRLSQIMSAKKNSESISQGLQREPQKDLSRILRTEAAIKAIECKANSTKYSQLWPKAVLDSLDVAIREKQWESALKIFSLLRKQLWYEPRCQTYTKLLIMLGKCNQPKQVGLLFEIMRSDGIQPTIDVYTALIGAYGLNGFLDEAFFILDEMKSAANCKPDVYMFSTLINCCIKSCRFDLIKGVLTEMSYLGIDCNDVTYNTIIDGYGKTKQFNQMESVLTDMIESGTCLPDVFTFNSIIGAYGKYGDIERMEKWFDEFQLMGVKPDIRTFNILIRSYGKSRMYEKMESVMEFMQKRFYSPTIVTFNIFIEMFGKAGDIQKMEEYFLRMKDGGMKPNTVTYCSVVSAYSKCGLVTKVDSVMRQVENSDVVLDTAFFNCVIYAYGMAGDVRKIGELYMSMKERKLKPDSITFTTMIQFYNTLDMPEFAQQLHKEMIAAKNISGMKLMKT
ncbi:pentatricopeptide repeat-containing protein At3g53170 [Impatiens glandulifera]|uniref:pentatricopeptide repeat-containing protein At3g53170 n=1 Tax=Impatiens glandulifera TaxID=253017 RepID=UPI001FB0BBF3|nr:pentatricopeptide repeat-containing protein At3g53170 [Impatiens glandulifera]